jgi:glycine oxidase
MGTTPIPGTAAATPAPPSPFAATADDAGTRKCYDVAVIGGGVVGHGIAWAARRSGRTVALIDDAPGSGASWAAAGMLAPVSELHYQEEALLELMLESSRLWPAFAAGLEGTGLEGTGPEDRARERGTVPATSRRRPSPWGPTPPTAGRSRTCAWCNRPPGWRWSR